MVPRYRTPKSVKDSVEANKSLRGDGIVEHTNASKGKTSGLSMANLLPFIPKAGGEGGTYRGVITQCPDEDNIGKAHRITSTGEESEEVDVYIQPGLWCNKVGRNCLLHAASDDIADYIASDLLPLYAGEAASGTYTSVNATELANRQISVEQGECGG